MTPAAGQTLALMLDSGAVGSPKTSFEEVLKSLYPSLTLVEWARLVNAVERAGLPLEKDVFSEKHNFRWGEDFSKVCDLILELDEKFLFWANEKQLSTRDLAPLRALASISSFQPYLLKMCEMNPSRSEGVQALEWMVDLFLMGHDLKALVENPKSFSNLLRSLRQKRFPLATQQEAGMADLVQKLPWPKKAQARVLRQGDLSGIEIKFFVQSPSDMKTQLDGLAHVMGEMSHCNPGDFQ